MQATHTLTHCPLYNYASTLTIDSATRTITHASNSIITLLDQQDPTGTRWPSKQDQQLCFTTLVTLNSKNGRQRQKRLLTCEHANNDQTTTTILCADISVLEQLCGNNNNNDGFFFNSMMMDSSLGSSSYSNTMPTIILRLNPYGVIQSVFSSLHTPCSKMIGHPLMRFIHNDDIPTLCSKLRQVTRYQQDIDQDENSDVDVDDDDDDTEFTSISFDLRCDLSSIFYNNNKYATKSLPEKDTFLVTTIMEKDDADHDTLYHFTTVVTSTQDIVCVMRPSTMHYSNEKGSRLQSSFYSSSSRSSISSSSSFDETTTRRRNKTTFSPLSHFHSLYRLSQLLRSSSYKLKDTLQRLQQALWDAAEQGLMMLAHYLAVVMVLTLQYYQLARHSSFWLETSELALRCLVAETKTRSELNRVFSWLEWSGLPSRRLFSLALDHGSEWLISMQSSSLSL
ncbi:hypothetical protein BC941DRAFT_425724 [Chlamydoabsidia padenii]|nr:hypothetical protein BC941DRAFT_425724 [Chlamydoabsidia padenii]